jgi:hypothetical protein
MFSCQLSVQLFSSKQKHNRFDNMAATYVSQIPYMLEKHLVAGYDLVTFWTDFMYFLNESMANYPLVSPHAQQFDAEVRMFDLYCTYLIPFPLPLIINTISLLCFPPGHLPSHRFPLGASVHIQTRRRAKNRRNLSGSEPFVDVSNTEQKDVREGCQGRNRR